MKKASGILLLVLALGFVFGCTRGEWDGEQAQDDWEFLEADETDGPRVLFEPEAEEFAMVPFPNDVSTALDPDSATGVRVNLEQNGKTDLERRLIKHLNEMDGFCTFCAIRVNFDQPLDLNTISREHIYGVNVTPGEYFGELVEFDLGDGYFPIVLEAPQTYFPNDQFAASDNQLFADGNRRDCYEDATNTLRLRAMTPLRQQSRYVIAVTKGLTGEDGEPIQPPAGFAYKTFPEQREDVATALDALAEAVDGFQRDEVAFAWRFTTMSVTGPQENIRAGFYDEGPFAYLADEFPARISRIDHFSAEIDHDGNEYVMNAQTLQKLVDFIDLVTDDISVPVGVMLQFGNVDYLVGGAYTTPLFLDTEDRIWDMDWQTGEAVYGEEAVPFYISVPKPTEANGYAQPPYPVALFLHANIRSRLDMIALADWMAAQGIAVLAIDAAEHGPESYLSAIAALLQGITDPPVEGLLSMTPKAMCTLILKIFYPSIDPRSWSAAECVDYLFTETWLGAALYGRSYDVNGDGFLESGMSFFTADMFRSRDIARQTQVDMFLAVKLLRELGTDWDGEAGLSMMEGDFNQDGVLDVGGPEQPIYFIGMSLGSLFGSGFAALEPNIDTVVLNVPGGGLVDTLQRTTIKNVVEPIRNELTGPNLVGRPDTVTGQVALTYNLHPIQNKFATIRLNPGAKVRLTNLANEESDTDYMDAAGNFNLAVPCDKGDLMELRVISSEGELLETLTWPAEYFGFGIGRNTPEGRNFIDNAQWVVDGCDPINFVDFFAHPRPGNGTKNVLMQFCNPDDRVPISNGIRLADAAGIISAERQEYLLDLGLLNWTEGFTLTELSKPYEAVTGSGWRIFPAYNHEFLLAPQGEENALMFSWFSRTQAAIYFKTHGAVIADDIRSLVPEDLYVEGYE